ncbi:MAG: tetratricopeptide repeat protein [Elusimicrobia bacterium]|nr:tetratricopeptide repeat protein [Elusimicrobiota bacterium]
MKSRIKKFFLLPTSYLLAKGLVVSCLLTVFLGCSVDYQFKRAETLKDNGKFLEAVKKYESIVEKNPQSIRVPEAFYNIGKIYQQNLENNDEAKIYYKRVINEYSATEWAVQSKELFLEIADYFPLLKGLKWVEVDSETSGKYMLARNEIVAEQNNIYEMTRNLYTRNNFVSSFRKYFKKMPNGLYETDKNGEILTAILLFPLEVNKEWVVGNIKNTIVSKKEEVEVAAGKFSDCIKIKKQLIGTPSWSVEYYAPEVGKILTTQSSGSGEKRITELKEFTANND